MDRSLGDLLSWAETKLTDAGIATAHLDALVLLEDCSGIDRAHILSSPEKTISITKTQCLKRNVIARTRHLPLAYIRGKCEFYGREFMLNQGVLQPRPESEALIESLLRLPLGMGKNKTVIDVGTGSGALIVTAKLELPSIKAIAVDIDSKCLKTAQKNATKYGLEIQFLRSNLLDKLVAMNLLDKNSLIIANLPYIPDNWSINRAASHEPRQAIFGGSDGLDLYRRLFGQLRDLPTPPLYVLTEAMPPQHKALKLIASKSGFVQKERNDFAQLFMHLSSKKKS